MNSKRVGKSDGKRVAAKMGQEPDLESPTPREVADAGARGGPLLSWRVNPPLAGPGLRPGLPAARVDVLAGLD